MIHRGWCKFKRARVVHTAEGGVAAVIDDRNVTVFADRALFILSDYDWEYRNRVVMGLSVVDGP